MIKYRWLTQEEFPLLAPVFAEQDAALPNPLLSAVFAAFNDAEELVGFHVLQLVPHAEPMWIHPEYRAKVNWREFQRGIESLFDHAEGGTYFIFPGDERIAKLCKRGGMTEMPIKAWKREL